MCFEDYSEDGASYPVIRCRRCKKRAAGEEYTEPHTRKDGCLMKDIPFKSPARPYGRAKAKPVAAAAPKPAARAAPKSAVKAAPKTAAKAAPKTVIVPQRRGRVIAGIPTDPPGGSLVRPMPLRSQQAPLQPSEREVRMDVLPSPNTDAKAKVGEAPVTEETRRLEASRPLLDPQHREKTATHSRDPRWKGIFEELISIAGTIEPSETRFLRFSRETEGMPEVALTVPAPVTASPMQLIDPSERFDWKLLQLARTPRRTRLSAPVLSNTSAPWRCGIYLLPTTQVMREHWQKVAGLNSTEFPEAEFRSHKPVWAVSIHADIPDDADVPPAADASVQSDELKELRVLRSGPLSLGGLAKLVASPTHAVQMRGLRLLHEKSWHAPMARMETLLERSGNEYDKDKVDHIIKSCRPCQLRAAPPATPVAGVTYPGRNNQQIEADNVSYQGHPIFHMVDRYGKLGYGNVTVDRALGSALGVCNGHMGFLGPPDEMLSDKEGALKSKEAKPWLKRRGTSLELVPKQTHFGSVEKRGDLMKTTMHILQAAAEAEGITLEVSELQSEAQFSLNGTLEYGGFSPVQTTFGRSADWSRTLLEDKNELDGPFTKAFRVRCLAGCAAREAVYRQRVHAAGKSRAKKVAMDVFPEGTRGEVFKREVTDGKDIPGWKGPVVIIGPERSGSIKFRWESTGKEDSAPPHLLRLFGYKAQFFVGAEETAERWTYPLGVEADSGLNKLMALAESQGYSKFCTHGSMVTSSGELVQTTETVVTKFEMAKAARVYAHEALGMAYVQGVRAWRGVRKVPGIHMAGEGLVMTWLPDAGRGFEMATVDASRPVDVNRLTKGNDWLHRCGLLMWSYMPVFPESERRLHERWHDAEEGSASDGDDTHEFEPVPNTPERGQNSVPSRGRCPTRSARPPTVVGEPVTIPPPRRNEPVATISPERPTSSSLARRRPTSSAGRLRRRESSREAPHEAEVQTDSPARSLSPERGTQTNSTTRAPSGVQTDLTGPNSVSGLDSVAQNAASSAGGALGGAIGGAIGTSIGGAAGGLLGEVLGESAGSALGPSVAASLSPRFPRMPTFPPASPNLATGTSSSSSSSAVPDGPLFLPGLADEVTVEEWLDPGDPTVEIDSVQCRAFMNEISKGDIPREVLLQTYSHDQFLTDMKTGCVYKVDHLASGELTKDGQEQHGPECAEAKIVELTSWTENKAIRLRLRAEIAFRQNMRKPMSSRWVLTWKWDPVKQRLYVMARLCVRGYQVWQSAVIATAAATASVLTHRVFCSTSVNTRRPLFSLDIGSAHMKGEKFDEVSMSQYSGQAKAIRGQASFVLPSASDWALLYRIDAEGFHLMVEYCVNDLLLECLKGGYGLKDAPRLFRLHLHKTLVSLGMAQSRYDECVYLLYDRVLRPMLSVVSQDEEYLRSRQKQEEQRVFDPTKPEARAGKLIGVLAEIYFSFRTTRQLRIAQEDGSFMIKLEVVVDAKSLYGIITADSEPKPRDDGSLLSLRWVRERILSGAIKAVSWCTAQDQLSDCTTKPGVETSKVELLMSEGKLRLGFSVLRNGTILDGHKGHPAPKSQRKICSAAFVRLCLESGDSVQAFVRALASGSPTAPMAVLTQFQGD